MNIRSLPIRNLKRRPGRTAALICLVALLAMTLLGGSALVLSLRNGLAGSEARLGADIICIPATAKSKVNVEQVLLNATTGYWYMDSSLVEDVREAEGVEAVSAQVFFASLRASCCSASVQLIGIDQDTDFVVQPWISRSYGGRLGELEVIAGCDITADIGETITFYGTDCTVAGRLDETGTGMDTSVYANMETIRILLQAAADMGHDLELPDDPETVVSAIYVKAADDADVSAVANYLKVHVRKLTTIQTKSLFTEVAQSLTAVSKAVTIMIAAIWLLILIVLLLAFAMITGERRREFAVLRVMGCSRRMLSRLVLRESAMISLAGGLIGIALAALIVTAFSPLIESKLGLPFLLPSLPQMLLLGLGTLVLVLLIGPLASARSARRLSRVDPGLILRETN